MRALLLLTILALGCAAPEDSTDLRHPGTPPAELPRIPPPSADAAHTLDGYRAEIAVDQLVYPTSVDFDDQGAMLVAEAGFMDGDPVAVPRILRITWKEGKESGREVLTQELSPPVNDILWHRGKLYISHRGKISVLEGGKVRHLVTGLPSRGDHHNNQLTSGPDGLLYFGQGTATNSGVVGLDSFAFGWLPLAPDVRDVPARDLRLRDAPFQTPDPLKMLAERKMQWTWTSAFQPFGRTMPAGTVVKGQVKANGTILRMNPDGSRLEVYAWGLRNPFGVLWGPDNRLYAGDNGYDERGSRPIANAPECLHVIRPGAWYGWPDFAAGIPVTDPRYRSKAGPAPEFLLAEHPPLQRPWLTFEPHAGLTKMDFSRSLKFGGTLLYVSASGDYAPVTAVPQARAGYYVARIHPETRHVEKFFHARKEALGPKDLEYVATAGPKRPVDVRFSPDGSALYVVDYGAVAFVRTATGPQPRPFPGTGVIWRIVPSATPKDETR